ncbi:LanC-like protein 2 [Clonorchis sinensis]|uniref:LanC-like protein 2 n=1 Tax=Clonorchis sinensis TaxID=79923 RepID=H2KSY7_CLOSI|nr:LanC-like protein 2 [Clonorchis sinensis]
MYTGLAGIGLFFLKLSRAPEAFIDHTTREDARNFSQKITRRCLRHVDTDRLHKNVSVFTSSVGALCLAALDESDSAAAEKYLEQILACAKFACDLNSSMPDEALYGRSGYINALLTLGRENRQIPANVLAGVVDAVLQSGLRTAKRYQSDGIYRDLMRHSNLAMPPLMYEWHDKTYLGGAHGFAGILLTLIKVHRLCPNALSDKSMQELVLPTVHWMGELQMSSGNWPSSLGRSMGNDVLVHWCHGATGVVPLMLAAYQLTGDKAYLTRAIRGGEAIWARGLLYKGCGLCHGSAGSGYTLLDLHRVTKDPKYLYRAAKFAEWCTDCFKNRTRVADRPYSLFEGLAGTLYFLVDILEPTEARFPLLSAP